LAEPDQAEEGRNIRKHTPEAAVVNRFTGFLTTNRGHNDDHQHPDNVANNRQRHGGCKKDASSPPGPERDHSIDDRESDGGDQAAHATTRGSNIILIVPGGIVQDRAVPEDINRQYILADAFDNFTNHQSQGESDLLAEGAHRNAKCEKNEREERFPEPLRPPGHAGQAINANEKSHDRDAGLLHAITEKVQQKGENEDQKAGGPGAQRQGEQFLAVPPKNPQDDERNNKRMRIVPRIDEVHPIEQRGRMDEA